MSTPGAPDMALCRKILTEAPQTNLTLAVGEKMCLEECPDSSTIITYCVGLTDDTFNQYPELNFAFTATKVNALIDKFAPKECRYARVFTLSKQTLAQSGVKWSSPPRDGVYLMTYAAAVSSDDAAARG